MFKGLLGLKVLLGSFLVLVVACGGAAAPTAAPATPTSAPPPPAATSAPPAADGGSMAPADGETIFTTSGGCAACHTIEGIAAGMVGPDLTHIGTDAASRKPGTSAEDYIRESITNPEDFVPEGVERAVPGLMTAALTSGLSADQVDALVEFLAAQK